MRVMTDTIFSATVNNETETGETVSIEHLCLYNIHAVWTGASANGTIKLQASNDALTWADEDGSEVTISGPGNQMWNFDGSSAKYVRLSVTSADTNDIVVTAIMHAKGV